MKAARIHSFGGPDVVGIGDAATPKPQAREVLVSVEAASVNPLDLKIIAGYMKEVFPVEFPYVPGTDFSGVVEAVGAQLNNLTAADRVVGRSAPERGGAFARGVTIPAADLCVIPANMSLDQAAALPTAFGTARQALFETGQLQYRVPTRLV
jgi:NADPH:quinone reductase-like Zn-dependent oxidoreductase